MATAGLRQGLLRASKKIPYIVASWHDWDVAGMQAQATDTSSVTASNTSSMVQAAAIDPSCTRGDAVQACLVIWPIIQANLLYDFACLGW